MYYNPEYMNPIMQGLNQPAQPQQGIASLAPTQPTQPIPEHVQETHYPSLRGGGGSLFPFPGMNSTEVGTVDPIMQGFQNSEFRKNANMYQQDAVDFTYDGKDMMMNSSMAGAFKQYLDSIGKGDLYESNYGLVQDQTPLQGLPLDQHPLMAQRQLFNQPYAQQATPPQPPTAPPLTQTAPPQGIASLAGTNPGI